MTLFVNKWQKGLNQAVENGVSPFKPNSSLRDLMIQSEKSPHCGIPLTRK